MCVNYEVVRALYVLVWFGNFIVGLRGLTELVAVDYSLSLMQKELKNIA